MNIFGISGFSAANVNNTRSNGIHTKFGLKMSAPLAYDTVSFGATKKNVTNEDRKYGVNLKTAKEIHDEALLMQPKVHQFAHKTWGKYLVSDTNPTNPILKISDRCKSALSIKEKSETRHLKNKKEVFEKMTDLNGMKLVMRDARKESVDEMLMELVLPIRNGDIELLEIENKRPIATKNMQGAEARKYDYASYEILKGLERTQNEKNKASIKHKDRKVRVDMDDFTNMNYSAIHMLLRLKGEKRPFELTIMGADVNQLKDLDDKLFKILNGKEVDKRYDPIKSIVKPLTKEGNEDLLEKFNNYRADAFLFQRNRAPSSYTQHNRPVHFLPLSEDLDPRLDLTELYNLMTECDKL